MTPYVLCLEIDPSGLNANIFEKGRKSATLIETCRVLFDSITHEKKDESEGSDNTWDFLFNTALDSLAGKMEIQRCSDALVLISPTLVSFRNITLPFSSLKKVNKVLALELENRLPVAGETYVSDFYFLSRDNREKRDKNENLIFTASARESIVEAIVDGLKKIGITPGMITVTGLLAAQLMSQKYPETPSCIFLYFCETEIILMLVTHKKPAIIRSMPVGMTPENLAKSIKQTIIGFRQKTGANENFPIFFSGQKDVNIPKSLARTFETVFESKSSHHTHESSLRVEKIASGDLSPFNPENKGIKSTIDFCKGKYENASFLKTYSYPLAVTVSLCLAAFLLSLFSLHSDIRELKKDVALVDSQMISLFRQVFPLNKKIQDPYLELKASLSHLLKKQESPAAGNANSDQTRAIDILLGISESIPGTIDLKITRLLLNDSRLLLSGSTDHFNSVDKIKSRLAGKDLFKTVDISSAAMDKKNERVNVKFVIEL